MTAVPGGFTAAEELDAHLAMMRWFEDRRLEGRELVPFAELDRGFHWHGHTIKLIARSQGIWKPAGFEAALTFKTAAPRSGRPAPYEDRVGEDGILRYKMAPTRDKEWSNRAMMIAAERRYPLAWLVGTKPADTLFYYARFPAYIKDVDPRSREFLIFIGDTADSTTSLDVTTPVPIEKRYASRWTKARLHQHDFREQVISAYDISCAVCDLPHAQLIEGAHITPDSDASGAPEVSNGIALCRVHHTAYDRNLLGIDDQLRVHIADRAVMREMTTHRPALSPFEGRRLMHIPSRRILQPDDARLHARFHEFEESEERFASR